MPSQLDLAIDATIARLMDNDGPLSLTYAEKYGVQMPVFAKAPGNMSDYLAFFCATHADKEFLVDGDIGFPDLWKFQVLITVVDVVPAKAVDISSCRGITGRIQGERIGSCC